MTENNNKGSNKKRIVVASLISVALVAGIATMLGMTAIGALAAQKEIAITNEKMPPTPEIEMQVYKQVDRQQVSRPDAGSFPITAGTNHTFYVILVSHDDRDFDSLLRVYNANDATAETQAFARVTSTEADRGFPPGLTVSTVPNDRLTLEANSQEQVTVNIHTTQELKPCIYQIAVAIKTDQEIEGEPVIAHVQGEIIAIEVV